MDDAERAAAVAAIVADVLRQAAQNLPSDQLVAAVMNAANFIDRTNGLLGPLGDLLGGLG